jgi:hypothetical protein
VAFYSLDVVVGEFWRATSGAAGAARGGEARLWAPEQSLLKSGCPKLLNFGSPRGQGFASLSACRKRARPRLRASTFGPSIAAIG